MTLAAAAIVAAVWSASAPLWLRLVALALLIAAGLDQTFRHLPAFDPLGRIRWYLAPVSGTKRCALTFDDGPTPATAAVLDILKAEQVPATFFVLGTNVERHPETAQVRDLGARLKPVNDEGARLSAGDKS